MGVLLTDRITKPADQMADIIITSASLDPYLPYRNGVEAIAALLDDESEHELMSQFGITYFHHPPLCPPEEECPFNLSSTELKSTG